MWIRRASGEGLRPIGGGDAWNIAPDETRENNFRAPGAVNLAICGASIAQRTRENIRQNQIVRFTLLRNAGCAAPFARTGCTKLATRLRVALAPWPLSRKHCRYPRREFCA